MIIYLITINIISFIAYYIDKQKAKKNKRRISEYTLLILSIFGGMIGSLISMKLFHHKTKKLKFWLINSIALIIWLYILLN